jgi:hypothetical protein
MIIKYTNDMFLKAKANDLLPLECEFCHNTFFKKKTVITNSNNKKSKITLQYCSQACNGKRRIHKMACSFCGNIFERPHSENIKRNKSKRRFCSHSCAARYNNAHKKTGTRRSKFEKHIEKILNNKFKNLEIIYNDHSAINSELDIYIPSLLLAFELNGIFHYEPIYGKDKLKNIQSNDTRKFQACLENSIELCIINISSITYYSEKKMTPIADIINSIIQQKLDMEQY